MKKKYNTILFDFDGTLMNTNELIIASWQYTFKTLRGKEEDLDKIISTFGEPLIISMKNFFGENNYEEALDIYRNFQREIYRESIKLCDGVEELLKTLYEEGYRMAIVSSRLKSSLLIGIEKYHMEDYFETVISADDTTEHKPGPAPALAALEIMNVAPENALMVGDSIFDILCAKNAGVDSVLVGWAVEGSGSQEKKQNLDCEPTYFIEKADQLLDIIHGVN